MPKARVIASFAIALCLCLPSYAKESDAKFIPSLFSTRFTLTDLTVNREYCKHALTKVDELVSKSFYSAEISKSVWSEAKAKYSEKILASKNLMELSTSMNLALDRLHSSHCHFVTINDEVFYFLTSLFVINNYTPVPHPAIDYTGMICGGTALPNNQVRNVLNDSPAEAAQVHVGDKILSVDGQPFIGQANFFKKSDTRVTIIADRNGTHVELSVKPVRRDDYESYISAIWKSAKSSTLWMVRSATCICGVGVTGRIASLNE